MSKLQLLPTTKQKAESRRQKFISACCFPNFRFSPAFLLSAFPPTPGAPARLSLWRAVALRVGCCLLLLPLVAPAADARPPERMTYQGFLADGTGTALATNAPKNYDVVFRIWNDSAATDNANRLWTEQQTVTVDKGYFSVLLGEGTAFGGEPQGALSTLFTNTTASDRYVEMTVKGIGAVGADVRILPRIRLLTSPYAYLATSATKLVNTTSGGDLITGSGGTVIVNGPISAANPANSFAGNGAALTALNGTNIDNASIDVAKLVAAVQQALCPPGSIVAYGGNTAPAGWFLCDGAEKSATTYAALYAAIGNNFGFYNGQFRVPDFRGKFLRGRDGGAGWDPNAAARYTFFSGGASGDAVGSFQYDELESHAHTTPVASDRNGNPDGQTDRGWDYWTGNQALSQNYITGPTGGNETRPVNIYVNYIIKY